MNSGAGPICATFYMYGAASFATDMALLSTIFIRKNRNVKVRKRAEELRDRKQHMKILANVLNQRKYSLIGNSVQ